MNQTTSTRQPCPETHGRCRLTCGAGQVMADAIAGGYAILSIRPDNGAWADYWTQAIQVDGRTVGHRLEKLVGHCEDKASVYDISVADGWSRAACDCPDATYRQRQCKHITALRNALERHGLLVESQPVAASQFNDFDDP